MFGLEIKIVFEETDPTGQDCKGCLKPMTEKTWVGMLQVGGPENAKPIDKFVFCTECKDKFESE